MEKKAKVANFTAENVAKMTADYKANPTKETVSALAKEFGKSDRSIVAKLVNLGIYKKAEKAGSEGEAKETKEKIVTEIAKLCSVSDELFESLAGATKAALVALRDKLKADAEEFASETE